MPLHLKGHRLVILVFSLIFFAGCATSSKFAKGVLAYNDHNEKEATADFKAGCAEGDQESCAALARRLELSGDITGAAIAYDRACKSKNADACLWYGQLEARSGHLTAAERLYRAACEIGSRGGCGGLGILLFGEKGKKAKSLPLLQNACETFGGYTCYELGLDETAKGNLSKAREYFTRSCFVDETGFGCSELARSYAADGKENMAQILFTNMCHQGSLSACEFKSALRKTSAYSELAGHCAKGDSSACLEAGAVSELKGGTRKAAVYLQRGCKLGSGRACYLLAAKDLSVHGGKPDSRLLDRGCRLGHVRSCVVMASLTAEREKSFDVNTAYSKACNNGDGLACFSIAERISGMKGHTGLSTFKKACDLGSSQGCLKVAELELADGDRNSASKMYKRLCDAEYGRACYRLAGMFVKDGSKRSEMKMLAGKACSLFLQDACIWLGSLEFDDKNEKRAAELWKGACDKGNLTGCAAFGLTKYKQDESGRTAATALFERACEGASGYGCYLRGYVAFENRDSKASRASWRKACILGYLQACRVERFEKPATLPWWIAAISFIPLSVMAH